MLVVGALLVLYAGVGAQYNNIDPAIKVTVNSTSIRDGDMVTVRRRLRKNAKDAKLLYLGCQTWLIYGN